MTQSGHMAKSTWFVTSTGSMARVDEADGHATWTGPLDIGEMFPALSVMGVYGKAFPHLNDVYLGKVIDVQQTAINEAVFSIGVQMFFANGSPGDTSRSVRLDMATGQVLEYPATFASNFKGEGWRRYHIWPGEAWESRNIITKELLAHHNWGDRVFTLPNGELTAIPANGIFAGIDRGKLYVKTDDTSFSYRVFDLDNLTCDGVLRGVPSMLTAPTGFTEVFVMDTDPDSWRASRPAPEFDRALLTAINSAAHDAGVGVDQLLRVMYAESGLRTGAYHPAGRYGLLQLTAEQLTAAGWTKTPQEYLDAGADQLPVIAAHLKSLGLPSETDEAGLWLCFLLGRALTAADLTVPLASAAGPRPELWASHGVADVDGDGVLTVDDVMEYIGSIRHDARFEEVLERMHQMSAVVPAWANLEEINEGDDMGMVSPSATSLGLLVDISWDQNNPNFGDQQVESIDPAPGTLQRLVDPVRVTINSVGR
ncbi:lytic transglycosylase domain-containing protein [Mycolicibacterium sp. 018/SC-01/001]|uniref:lytic transglycosylase domain-containing protein n=1 Tax=Mycolicibacterium sp. 018/SC-01/001 TaxID=2592069 RepID=UPI0011805235|nr:lytic transglycosylase domain-containing protein [Mycolicibacterium sp. 018/SC-01/001]TRW86251.1 lytic transglycosylase domain-containing protein [Mycolicibacterium sp. 018/SC-01/001]